MKARQFGFGGLQFVLSIAVIGVMATVAVPQYKSFMSKAKMTEAFNLAGESRKKVTEFVMTSGRFPQSINELDAVHSSTVSPPEHVDYMVVESEFPDHDVVIKVYLQAGVVENLTGEEQYIYVAGRKPKQGGYLVEWNCGGNGIDAELLPEDCQA